MPVICENCGILIHWQPTVFNGKYYCCVGCSQGGPCTCDYEHLPQKDNSAPSPDHDSATSNGVQRNQT